MKPTPIPPRAAPSERVTELLRSTLRGGRKLLYRPNGGNAGDALINVGFFDLCHEAGIPYAVMEHEEHLRELDDSWVLVMGGGGNLVPYWPATTDFIARIDWREFDLILLPQSAHDVSDFMARHMRQGDHVFLREEISYEYLLGLELPCSLGLDHDMAFNVDAASLLRTRLPHLLRQSGVPRLSRNTLLRHALFGYQLARARLRSHAPAYRTDGEARGPIRGSVIHDLSRVAAYGTETVAANRLSAAALLKMLRAYARVSSDRLHVMIARALLGLPVEVSQNNYHKIIGVYRYTLKDRAPYDALVTIASD